MKLRCLIVEDERLAQNILVKFISVIDTLVLVKTCDNALEALPILHQETIDLLFLDINLPELTGLELLRSLPHPPHVIITTAYSEYALLGYELAVTDYLLKPFAFERFLKAVNKVIAHHKALVGPAPTPESSPALLLKAGRHVQQFQLDTILYLEGCGNYVKLHTREKTVLLHETLSYVATLLPENRFVRIHKSYLVALDRIERLEANAVHMAGKTLPVGNTYKQSLQAVFARKMQEGG